MKLIEYISSMAVPLVIFIIILCGVKEKKNVFDLFVEGAKEGTKISLKIFPTLIGLFAAIGALRGSGFIDFIINILQPALSFINFPKEIMPLALLRPISGSGAIAVATDIIKQYGVDSNLGIMAATIMGATETTFYTIAIYSTSVKVKNTRFVLWAALTADVVGILASVAVCRIMS